MRGQQIIGKINNVGKISYLPHMCNKCRGNTMNFTKHTLLIIFIFTLYHIAIPYTVSASEIHITDNHIVLVSDNGKNIDANEEYEEIEVNDSDNIEINDGGVCVGCAINNGGQQKVNRTTKLDNVTIITKDGKTTIYRKRSTSGESGKKER